MNCIHRKIFSRRLGAYVAVAETTKSQGKSTGVAGALLAAVLLAGSGSAVAQLAASALPTGGQVTAGQASISQQGNTLTVGQSSQRAAIDWQSFNVGSGATVQFVQPNASAVALNRVSGVEASVIEGAIRANGQVWLVNPNGVLFGQGARVDVGGLVASTRDISNADFMAGGSTFTGSSRGEVRNLGQITAADNGYVALIGRAVKNDGVVTARLGTVAAGAGDRVSLNFGGNALVGVTIEQGALDALVDNGGAIRADGGQILLKARTASSLIDAVVNNTGELRARTIASREGRILLISDMQHGVANVAGTLDASAPDGGNGGFIDTSAASVHVADGTRVTTQAANGLTGTWLIDPDDFTIAAGSGALVNANGSAGSIGATTLATSLASNNVSIVTGTGNSGNGDIFVNAPVTWASGNTLTLRAARNILINESITATGTTGKLALEYGQGAVAAGNIADYVIAAGKKVNLQAGANFSTKLGSDGSTLQWTVITSLGAAQDASTAPSTMTLQGLAAQATRTGRWVLGADIDMSATAGWNSGAGFTPIGSAAFNGNFDGLGHTLSNLTIDRTAGYVGLFGSIGQHHATTVQTASVRNLTLLNPTVTGDTATGSLAGRNFGTVTAVGAVGATVTTRSGVGFDGSDLRPFGTGGLVGTNGGIVQSSYTDSAQVGTLVGNSDSGAALGGLVGVNDTWNLSRQMVGYIKDSYSANVTVTLRQDTLSSASGSGTGIVGGLVGSNNARVIDSWSSGTVEAAASWGSVSVPSGNQWTLLNHSSFVARMGAALGGLVGVNVGVIESSRSSANVRDLSAAGETMMGGLVGAIGFNSGQTVIEASWASGTVTTSSTGAPSALGGLVGFLYENALVSRSYAIGGALTDNSTNGANAVGGLVGLLVNGGSSPTTRIVDSYARKPIVLTPNRSSYAGGLIGSIEGSNAGVTRIGNSYAAGTITGRTGNTVHAFIGDQTANGAGAPQLENNFYDSTLYNGLTGMALPDAAGQLRGMTTAQMKDVANFTGATAANGNADPTVGNNFQGWAVGNTATWNVVTIANDGYPCLVGLASCVGSQTVFLQGVSSVYGTPSALTYGFYTAATGGTLVTGVTFSGSAAWTGAPVATTGVGSYSVTYGGGLTLGTGYALGTTSGSAVSWLVTPLAVTLSGSRSYDGTSAIAGNALTVANAINGDTVTVGGTGSLASVNAGSRAITTTGLTLSNANYTLTGATGSVTINPVIVGVAANTGATRVYDRTDTAAASLFSLTGVLGADSANVTLGGSATLASRNAGAQAVTSVAGLSLSLSGQASGNYTLTGTALPSGTIEITKASLTANATVAARAYDGTTTATPTGMLTGVLTGDTVNLAVSGTYDSANAGSLSVTLSGASLTGTDAGNYLLSTALNGSTVAATINPKAITLTGATVAAKTYDGNSTATVTAPGTLTGLVGSETLGFTTTASFTGTTAGSTAQVSATLADGTNGGLAANYTVTSTALSTSIAQRPVQIGMPYAGSTSVTGSSLVVANRVGVDVVSLTGAGTLSGQNVGVQTLTGGSLALTGIDAGNYTLTGATFAITPKVLGITGSVLAAKTYDGNATGSLSTIGSLTGLVGSETLGVTVTSAVFSSVNASSSPVNATVTYQLASGTNGGLATNYSLAPETLSALINARPLTVAANVGATRVYDRTTNAAASLFTVTGVLSVDQANVSVAGNATLASRNVGARGVTSLAGLTLGGSAAGNYTFTGSALPSGTVEVTAAPLAATATVAARAYDGTTVAAPVGTLTGVITGDTVTLSVSGTYDAANAGARTVTLSGATLGGTDAGNYLLSTPLNGSTVAATINPKAITVTGATVAAKVYDGTSTAQVSGGTLAGLVGSETLNLVTTASFTGASAGSAAQVSATVTDGTGLASNYAVQPVASSVTIAQRPVSASLQYAGTTNVTGGSLILANRVGTDVVSVTGTGTLSGQNVGIQTLTGGSLGLTGTDAGNYTLTGATFAITPRLLTAIGTSVAARTYDGTTALAVANPGTLTGFVTGETVTIAQATGTLDNANAGNRTGNIVYVLGNGTGGGLATNYAVSPTSLPVTVAPRALGITGTSVAGKTFDGTTAATVTPGTLTGLVGNQTLGLSATGNFVQAGASTVPLDVLVNYLLSNGANGGVAANYTLAPQTLAALIGPRTLQYAVTMNGATRLTSTGGVLMTEQGASQVASATLLGTVPGTATPPLAFTLWRNGTRVSEVREAGTYQLRAVFAQPSTDYLLSDTGSTVAGFTVQDTDVATVAQASVRATQAPVTTSVVSTAIGSAPAVLRAMPATANVVQAPAQITTAFGPGARLSVLSAPSGDEPSENVTLEEARTMLGARGAQAGQAGRPDVRVPVGRDSLADLVNGGVRLPTGVDQLLFVVKQP